MIGIGRFYQNCKKKRIYKVVEMFDYQNKTFVVVRTFVPRKNFVFLNVYEVNKFLNISFETSEFEAGRAFGIWDIS